MDDSEISIEDTVKKKTFSIQLNKKSYINNIFKHLSSITKNIFNTTIYITNIYYKHKNDIFENSYEKYNDLVEKTDLAFYEILKNEIKFFYDMHSNKSSICNINHKFITNYIIKNYNGILLNNTNFYPIENKIIDELKDIIVFSNKYEFNDIIRQILKNRYDGQYYSLQKKMLSRIPFVIEDDILIDNVRNNEYLFVYKEQFKQQIKLDNKIKSDDNILKQFIYENLGNNYDRIPSDIICNTINKAQNTFASYWSKRRKGMFANKPNYIKDSVFIVPYFERSFIIKNNKARLTVGKYVAANYNTITNNNLICLNEEEKTEYKKYVDEKYLITTDKNKKIPKNKNYIIDNKTERKYIDKNDENIVNGYYVYIDIPKKICDKTIKMIEICPLYDGYRYKINFTYDTDKKIEDEKLEIIEKKINCNPNDALSIDLGMGNLMAIYDPSGYQFLIKGTYLISLNKKFNKKIDELNKKISKTTLVDEKEKLRKIKQTLLLKRENKINDHFNKIVKFMENKYINKKVIVIGYNINWKQRVNLGKTTNRKFYEIPYSNLLKKIKDKFGNKIIITEESYTSKCDALSFEKICKKEKYSGKRIVRGLFSSEKKKLINADLNGAINIMRKKIELKEIQGKSIYNPITIKMFRNGTLSQSREVIITSEGKAIMELSTTVIKLI
ncbi:putative transposase [Bodo saltans virus]|uniref:Transposase n=1 Tax=Bodo saltans virus TaxID=2024608 RepID=A0A2H4UVZ7_9VIRU|nr:putative transposase [Bodo saltans virus]ATZ81090.1 putative transposase [Bodo saltans virus]